MAVRCDRQVRGEVIESAKTGPRPEADGDGAEPVAVKRSFGKPGKFECWRRVFKCVDAWLYQRFNGPVGLTWADGYKLQEILMLAAMVQYVFKPNPGCDMLALLEMVKESARLWKKHGAEVSLWSVQVGEIGNFAFAARCESTAKLGATLEALNNDPAMATFRVKNMKANLATWVRSNQAYEVPI